LENGGGKRRGRVKSSDRIYRIGKIFTEKIIL
jgi:hypothetical protein